MKNYSRSKFIKLKGGASALLPISGLLAGCGKKASA